MALCPSSLFWAGQLRENYANLVLSLNVHLDKQLRHQYQT